MPFRVLWRLAGGLVQALRWRRWWRSQRLAYRPSLREVLREAWMVAGKEAGR